VSFGQLSLSVIIVVVFFINRWLLQLYDSILLILAGHREQRGTDSVFPSSCQLVEHAAQADEMLLF
jgi:hypothetical protein